MLIVTKKIYQRMTNLTVVYYEMTSGWQESSGCCLSWI